jgi:hypothetical protein
LCKGPSMVVITSHKGPMMVASYIVRWSLNSWYYFVLRSYDGCFFRCAKVLLMVVITLHKGPMAFTSSVLQRSFNV